jgi:hypothetical protein
MADEFLTTYTPLANDIATRTGIDPTVVLGIIDTETGGGKRVSGNNIFGISPVRNGQQYVEKYPDVETASEAFVTLMQTPRYRAVAAAGSPAAQAGALVKSGYNTVNPRYAEIVGNKATRFGQILGYQDGGQGTATPAAATRPASAPDYNSTLASPAPAPAAPATPAAPTGSAKQDVLAAPELNPTGAASSGANKPAPTSAKEQVLAAPELQLPAAPATAASPAIPDPSRDRYTTGNPLGDQGGTGGSAVPNAVGDADRRVRDAAYQAFINAPSLGTRPGNMSLITPEAQDWLSRNVPVIGPGINALTGLAGTAVGGVAALGAGGMQIANELAAGSGMDPKLQRDLNILAMTTPVAMAPSMLTRSMLQPPRPGPRTPDYAGGVTPEAVQAAEARGRVRNALEGPQSEAPSSPTDVVVMRPEGASSPGMGPKAANAQPAGAEITTAPIPEKTPAQRVTDLEKSVTQTAEDRAGPQMRDDTPYVADIPPRPLASREFHPKNSLDEKTAIGKDEAFRADIEKVRRLRNEGMVDKLREDAADANALDAAHEARQQVSPAELGVFDNEQPTSVAGLAAKIDKLLSGPEGKQRAVRTTLEDVKKSLYDADGNLETMPSRIYGARKNLTDLLKRGAKGVGDVADDVRASKHVLESLLTDFDESITKGAGQFQDYLKQWSQLSKPIDQMEFFQQYQTGSKKITDKDGYLIPTKVQKMLDDILQGHKAKGVNKAKSLTDEQIARVVAVRNELAADSLKDRMAAVKGSDTFQQFMQEAKTPGRIATGLKIAGELGIGIPTAGLGNFVLQRGLSHLERRALAKAAAEAAARKRELLSPPRNPLTPP